MAQVTIVMLSAAKYLHVTLHLRASIRPFGPWRHARYRQARTPAVAWRDAPLLRVTGTTQVLGLRGRSFAIAQDDRVGADS